MAEVLARFDAVVEEILAAGHQRVALVAHGAIIRAWSGVRVENVDADLVARHPLRNTGYVELERRDGTWWARTWDDHVL